jgi:hypothetical protein
MSIAYRSCTLSGSASGPTLTATVPAGVVNGDVLLLAVHVSGASLSPTITNPTGWTLLSTTLNGTSAIQKVYWRVASGEPSTYSITIANYSNSGSQTAMVALSGADTTAPVSAQYGGQANASSTSAVAPGLGSWSSSNGIDVAFFSEAGATDAGVTPPTNYTEPSGGDV